MSLVKNDTTFYLNYKECEVTGMRIGELCGLQFYLNYKECEVFNPRDFRDVNRKFYLNYKECEGVK